MPEFYQLSLERYCRRQVNGLFELLAADGLPAPRLQMLRDGIVDAMVSDHECKGCFVVNAAAERAPAHAETRAWVADQFSHIETASLPPARGPSVHSKNLDFERIPP